MLVTGVGLGLPCVPLAAALFFLREGYAEANVVCTEIELHVDPLDPDQMECSRRRLNLAIAL